MTEQFDYDKIDEILDLTRENNRILRTMHRRMLWSQIFTFIYWLTYGLSLSLGQKGTLLPWVAAWSPSLIFGFLAVILLNKVRR